MKPETLDALLIDRELGELPSETTELLEAYLAQTPTASGRAEVLVHTLATARRVTAPVCGTTALEFESVAAALSREESQARRRKYGLALVRVAAGVAFGIGVGWFWFASPPASRPAARIVQSREPHGDQAARGFWSRENFIGPIPGQVSASTESGHGGRLAWESLFRKPKVEEIP